jgi:G3E family GTPase
VLTEAHGQKIAVIENEFGEENIDSDILVTETKEQIIQMSNGCICCTIREDLRGALQLLAAKKRKGLLDFDRVIIETTGLADPGPVAQTFFMDDEIAETYLLDSILTLVDAKHAAQQLNDRQEARRQVGFADQLFISKTDLVAKDETDALIHRLKHMNPRAPMKAVHFGDVTLAEVFDLRGFNLNAKLDIDPDFLKEEEAHDHDHGMTMRTTTSMGEIATIPRTPPRATATTTITTTTSRALSSGPSAPSIRPSWRTSWAPSSTSTAPRCCATRAC